MYAKVENGVVVEWKIPEPAVLATRPNTSFALPLSDETLQELGFARFAYTVEPDHDPELEEVKEIAPVLDGIMARQSWEVVQRFSADEKASYIAKRDAERLEAQKDAVRARRNTLLSECDWTQLTDAPVDQAAWSTYRQALRDLTKQSGFPWTVDWPVAP